MTKKELTKERAKIKQRLQHRHYARHLNREATERELKLMARKAKSRAKILARTAVLAPMVDLPIAPVDTPPVTV